jgi:hypothetical protein
MKIFNPKYNIRTNIEIGRSIFEKIPNDLQPGWAGLVLSRFNSYNNNIPKEVMNLFSIIDNSERWCEAHEQFTRIRKFLLNNADYKPESYLLLAEAVAKITYNSSGGNAPFDSDSGWYIASLASTAAQYFDEDFLEEEVQSSLMLFARNKGVFNNLTAAKDLLIYKKIDDILWYDWDPISINDMAPRDEYQSYTPQIFRLKQSGATRQEIAELLLKLQTETMGMSGTIEASLVIADKIIEA